MDLSPAYLVTFSRREFYWLFYLSVGWLAVWGGHWLLLRGSGRYRASPWPWHRLVGLVLLFFPFIRIMNGIWESIGYVVTPGTVARAIPAEQWWSRIRRDLVQNLLVPFVGLYLASGHGTRTMKSLRAVGGGARSALSSVGMWPRVSWTRDVATGLGSFIVVFFAYVTIAQLLSQFRGEDTGDASAVFQHLTPLLAVALALMSGVTEEFLYRGVLVVRLRSLFSHIPAWGIVLGSSVFFGLAHAGYGTIANMLFPFLFGLVVGTIALLWGVWPAVIVHALVNFMVFLGRLYQIGHEWVPLVMTSVFTFAFVFPLVYFGFLLYRRFTRKDGPQGTGQDTGNDGPEAGPGEPEHRDAEQRNA